MSCYTWLTEQEFKDCSYVMDKLVNEALQELRKLDNKWYVREKTFTYGFFKKKTITQYMLLYKTHVMECAVINFYGGSIFGWVEAPLILAYMYGVISGFRKKDFGR